MADVVTRGRRHVVARDLKEQAAGDPVRVVIQLPIYGRGKEGGPVVVDTLDTLDVLIFPDTGERKFRHLLEDKDGYDRLAAQFERVDWLLSLHEKGAQAVQSQAKVTALFGGSRFGKSRHCLTWLVLQWIWRGPGSYAWVGRTMRKAWEVLTEIVPEVIPKRLRTEVPNSPSAEKAWITMVDGARIEMHHANTPNGGNLKAVKHQGCVADELSEWPYRASWVVLVQRTRDHQGSILVATTPVEGHWSEDLVRLAKVTVEVAVFQGTAWDNPWQVEEELYREILSLGWASQDQVEDWKRKGKTLKEREALARETITDPLALRELFGIWIASGVVLYSEFDLERDVVDDDFEPPYPWITDYVVAQTFTRFEGFDPHHVGGQDWNVNPMTTVVGKVWGIEEDPSTWGFLWVDEVQTVGDVQRHAERVHKRYPGIGIAADATGCHGRMHGSQNRNANSTNALSMNERGFDCRPCAGRWRGTGNNQEWTPHNPRQVESVWLSNKLSAEGRSKVHRRCSALIQGLIVGRRNPDGTIAKMPGGQSDRDSSPTDAKRYLEWFVLGSTETRRKAA